MENNISIIIADDHPIFRKGLLEVLAADSTITILHEAGNGKDAFELIKSSTPDIAILDIKMPGLTGFQVAELLSQERIPTKIIFLTMHNEQDIFEKAMDLKAMGYVLKECASDDLIDCIHSVASDKHYISPSISSFLVNRANKLNDVKKHVQFGALTGAELRVLKLIAGKKTSQEIADELFISRRTVENHRANICTKLEIHGANALLLFAIENKIVLEQLE